MFINNPSRIGMNYFSYGDDIKRFIINKILFLAGVIFCYTSANELLLYIATVVLMVPVIKKLISEAFSLNFCCEATLITCEVMFCIVSERIDSAVFFITVYFVFDAVLYVVSSHICRDFNENSLTKVNPVAYRVTAEGNYILSNNEYVPEECLVLEGEATIDTTTVSGVKNDCVDVAEGNMILPLYRIIKGSVVAKPIRDKEKSLIKAVTDMYSGIKIKNDASSHRIMSFSIGFLSVFIIFLTIFTLLNKCEGEWLEFSLAISLFACISPVLLFLGMFEYSFLSSLAKCGIYVLSPLAYDDISIIEGEKICSANDITLFGYYSHSLHRADANIFITKKKKILSFKKSFIHLLFIINIAAFFVYVFTEMLFPSAISVIATALVVAILSKIN